MKPRLLFLLPLLFLLGCEKDDKPDIAIKETVKMYIFASTGIYLTGTTPPILELSGTNIETVKNITSGSHILEVEYPKGEKQTLTLKSSRPDLDVFLQVSKTLSHNVTGDIVDQYAMKSLTVTFIAE
ncbi:hypothetical protein [Pedobacter arcticus]|uniref:hypothetical protein n=1 Tax=Pedobacter arcticus TaxID=752140 RepID=UPI000305E60A|nr:hypothetical protein [Pedobacter arcticus]